MFYIEKEFRFEAAHVLPHHDGKCARLHGHSWVGRVVIGGQELQRDGPKQGMLIDFQDISAVMKKTIDDKLDHYFLNESLEMENPTAEMLARALFGLWKQDIEGLFCVRIEETCTAAAEFRR